MPCYYKQNVLKKFYELINYFFLDRKQLNEMIQKGGRSSKGIKKAILELEMN